MPSSCAICHESFEASSSLVATKCGHVFHKNCLNQWLKQSRTCPVCRSKVSRRSLIKLIFHDKCNSDDNSVLPIPYIFLSLGIVREQLHDKNLEIEEKDKRILELNNTKENSQRDSDKLDRNIEELTNQVRVLTKKVEELAPLSIRNQKLLEDNSNLKNELEHLNNVKTIMEGYFNDVLEILVNVQLHVSRKEDKVATGKIAAYCFELKQVLVNSKERNTQLQNKLTHLKRQVETLREDHKKKIRRSKQNVNDLAGNSSSETVSCGPSHIPITSGLTNVDSPSLQSSNCASSTLVCCPSRYRLRDHVRVVKGKSPK